MNRYTMIWGFFLPIVILMAGCSQFSPSISNEKLVSDDEVVVSLKEIDYHFERARDFAGTYMVFGGGDFGNADMIDR